MSENQKISAVIITLNEEEYIEKCIKSLKDVVDEIVVVDSFSTDRTQEICERNHVTFKQREWEGYALTKNWANAQASHDFILSIDADEMISETLADSIKLIKVNLNSNTVYSFNRLNNYCGKWIKHA
ncbi:MAG: glycosyltransferase family 2 protein, partial [Bacteroidia bacterium]|nr:glycosyltransferase family 2 protein [Bacteroidia bacterium]